MKESAEWPGSPENIQTKKHVLLWGEIKLFATFDYTYNWESVKQFSKLT